MRSTALLSSTALILGVKKIGVYTKINASNKEIKY
jgi:hypothetical protein